MPEGKYIPNGELRMTALAHAVQLAQEGHLDADQIVPQAAEFHKFLTDNE